MNESLQELLQRSLAGTHVPGAVLAILWRGSIAVAAAGVLHMERRVPVRPDSVFQIGSITKAMTATLVMMLLERGRLALDVPVIEYLPELRLPAIPDAGRITMRHLLTHSSGIDGDVQPETSATERDCSRYVAQMSRVSSLHPVGRGFSYCNAGFVLAARVIEALSGIPWDEAMRQWLFEPLDLGSATTRCLEVGSADDAWGHVVTGAPPALMPQSRRFMVSPALAPAGATVRMRAADLLRFVQAHLPDRREAAGPRIIPASLARDMQSAQIALPRYAAAGAKAWGLGWCLYDWNGRTLFGHDGDTVGQFSFLRADPQSATAAVLLANGGDAHALADDVFPEVFGPRAPAGMASTALPRPAPADAAIYAGRYRRSGRELDVYVDGGQLSLRLDWAPQEGPHAAVTFRLDPVDEHVFCGRAPEGAAPIHFTFGDFDERGRARSVFSGYRLAIRQDR